MGCRRINEIHKYTLSTDMCWALQCLLYEHFHLNSHNMVKLVMWKLRLKEISIKRLDLSPRKSSSRPRVFYTRVALTQHLKPLGAGKQCRPVRLSCCCVIIT